MYMTLFDNMDRLMSPRTTPVSNKLRLSARQTDNKLVFTVDLPGVKRENLSVTTTGQKLRIDAMREDETLTEVWSVNRDWDITSIFAELADGVLTLTLLKNPAAEPISIEVR